MCFRHVHIMEWVAYMCFRTIFTTKKRLNQPSQSQAIKEIQAIKRKFRALETGEVGPGWAG